MSQEQIIQLLEKERKPLTLNQICLNLNQDKSKICKQLKKLVHYHEVSYTEIDRNEARQFGGKIKRRIKIYHMKEISYIIYSIQLITLLKLYP